MGWPAGAADALGRIAGATLQAPTAEAIDGERAAAVAEPQSPEAMAAVLAWASAHRVSVVVRGGASRLTWGRPPGPVDLILGTRGLAGILRHEPGDLTVTVGAGTPLSGLNDELSRHRQWLPIDVPSGESTIGGCIATNDSGPLRHRWGAPRDLLIGIQLAMPDGRLVKAGGHVVKNVAGYDLGKLVAGSFGSLAVITSATFKLAPLPRWSGTLACTFDEAPSVAGAAAALAGSQLDPLALEVCAVAGRGAPPEFRLLTRLAGVQPEADGQMAEAAAIAGRFGPVAIDRRVGEDDIDFWRALVPAAWNAPGVIVKAGWTPVSLPGVLRLVGELARMDLDEVELTGRVATGAGMIRLGGAPPALVVALEHLRRMTDVLGHVVIARAPRAIREAVDPWGEPGDTIGLLRALKGTFDPAGILNAGRGLV